MEHLGDGHVVDIRSAFKDYFLSHENLKKKARENLQGVSPVQEFMQPWFEFLDAEPVRVEGHHVWGAVLIVVPEEVLLQPLEDVFGVVVMQDALI